MRGAFLFLCYMAGIYLHIPFCKQACHYCNFHFSTSLQLKESLVNALLKEIELQKDYLQNQTLTSIYLGGGTPSLLSQKEVDAIFNTLFKHFSLAENAEITLEANPDDLTKTKLKELAQSPLNRLSIGIQSFSEEDLQYMNRAHNAQEASNCIGLAQEAGFENLTVDLIYGSPTTTHEVWAKNIETVLAFSIPHISCYCLTVEPKTALHHFVKTGEYPAPNDELAAQQFEYLIQRLHDEGFDHYEISNFAKKGWYAQHNSNYWLGKSYLGIGPAAHSFNGKSRQWNVAHNAQYIKAIGENTIPAEVEILSLSQQYNEYVMTSLRTIWGCDLNKIRSIQTDFGTYFKKQVQVFLDNKTVVQKEGIYTLTAEGKLLADNIAMHLFIEIA